MEVIEVSGGYDDAPGLARLLPLVEPILSLLASSALCHEDVGPLFEDAVDVLEEDRGTESEMRKMLIRDARSRKKTGGYGRKLKKTVVDERRRKEAEENRREWQATIINDSSKRCPAPTCS